MIVAVLVVPFLVAVIVTWTGLVTGFVVTVWFFFFGDPGVPGV